MPTSYPMPIPETVRELLTDLVGRQVTTTRVETPEFDERAVRLVADYLTDDGTTVGAVCIADLPLSAALGAALTMVPPVVVNESVRRGRFDEPSLVENFAEVVNVMSRLFNSPDTPHLRWRTLYEVPSVEVPGDVERLLGSPAARRDLEITVEGYGAGALSLFVD